MFKTKQVNDITIRPLRIAKTKDTDVYGSDMLTNPYGTIALIAKTNQGKSTSLYSILEHTIDRKRKAKVVIFSSTHDVDPTYEHIKQMLEKKRCMVFLHHHFMENGENLIDHYIEMIQEPPVIEEQIVKKRMPNGTIRHITKQRTVKEPEKVSAEWIFIFDDIPNKDLRSIAMNYVQRSRHYKIRTFICTQHLSNLTPIVRKQITTALLFRSFSHDKLRMIYEDLDVEIPFPLFEEVYKYATHDPYCFLTYDTQRQQFRKNFNTAIEINEE